MTSFSEPQLQFLSRFGFDAALFQSWQAAVRDGSLSLANNAVTQPILAPDHAAIEDLPTDDSERGQQLAQVGRDAIRRGELGVVVLNGGMATRFGGVVKGVVRALGEQSFLEVKLRDIARTADACQGQVPVWLMNSFATDGTTRQHLTEHQHFGLDPALVTSFTQFISVRMKPDGSVFLTDAGEISPYGPGHGDFAPALRAHGCLQQFRDRGGKHLFVCNVDNLGARVDPRILGHHIQSHAQATVECAPKWPGDVGGAPYSVDGRVQLVEQVRYPKGFDPDIVDVFNTNTFHFRADALDRDFDLGWYYVEKKVAKRKAVQIERLIGELTRFLSTTYLKVKRTGPRTRFFPIKTPDDLEAGREEIAEMYTLV